MTNKFEKVNELLLKEDFCKELKKAESNVDVQALFASNGVELSENDVENMVNESVAINGDVELDENALDNVAGGIVLTTTACFALAAASLAFYTNYGIHAFKKLK